MSGKVREVTDGRREGCPMTVTAPATGVEQRACRMWEDRPMRSIVHRELGIQLRCCG